MKSLKNRTKVLGGAIVLTAMGLILHGCISIQDFGSNSTPASTLIPSANVSSQAVISDACPSSGKVNVRFHYSANGTSGSWSGTTATNCATGAVTIGPQAMEGDLKLSPGTTLKTGYDFTLPGNKQAYSGAVINPTVVFTLRCVSGAAASPSTMTVAMLTPQYYDINSSDWIPSGDQKSPLVYQGSTVIPDACSGGTVRLDKGGTFSATIMMNNFICPDFNNSAGGIAYPGPYYDTVGKYTYHATVLYYPGLSITPGSCHNYVDTAAYHPALPAGLSVDPSTCAISGTPTTPTVDQGPPTPIYYKVRGQSNCGNGLGNVVQIFVAPAAH